MLLKRLASVLVVSAILAAPCVIQHLDTPLSRVSTCLSKSYLEVPCPGCNMTSAIHEAIHFRLLSSISMHPAGPLALICIAFTLLVNIASLLPLWRQPSSLRRRIFALQSGLNRSLGIFLISFWSLGFISPYFQLPNI